MYTAVLLLAMSSGADSPDFGRRGGCSGCYSGYGGCSGAYYGGCCGGSSYYRTAYGVGYAPRYASYYYPGYYNNPGYYNPGYYSYSYPAYSTTPGMAQGPIQTQQSFYPPSQAPAIVEVRLPNPDADVWFDNTATKQKGADRFFTSPPVDFDGTYTYTIKARWMDNGRQVNQERKVTVRPGQPTVVDFRTNQNQPEQLTNPKKATPKTTN